MKIKSDIHKPYEVLNEIVMAAFPKEAVKVVGYGVYVDGIDCSPVHGGAFGRTFIGVQMTFQNHKYAPVIRRAMASTNDRTDFDLEKLREKFAEIRALKSADDEIKASVRESDKLKRILVEETQELLGHPVHLVGQTPEGPHFRLELDFYGTKDYLKKVMDAVAPFRKS